MLTYGLTLFTRNNNNNDINKEGIKEKGKFRKSNQNESKFLKCLNPHYKCLYFNYCIERC